MPTDEETTPTELGTCVAKNERPAEDEESEAKVDGEFEGLLDSILNPRSSEQSVQQDNGIDQSPSDAYQISDVMELSKANEDTDTDASSKSDGNYSRSLALLQFESTSSTKDALQVPSPSPADAADSSSDKPSPEKISTAPEPPRWRFVKEAKKSMGYSSLHAGSYIKGKTNDELGANYVAPEISLYSPKEEKVEVEMDNVVQQAPTNMPMAKDDVEVGKLTVNVPPRDEFSSQRNEVGKLSIEQVVKPTSMDLSYGEFAGLSKSDAQSNNELRKPFKEWETDVQIVPQNDQEHASRDGNISDNDSNMTNDETPSKSKMDREVGKLRFHTDPGSDEEAFVGEVGKRNQERDGERGGGESEDSYGDAREGALFVNSNGGASNGKGDDDGTLFIHNSSTSNEQIGEDLHVLSAPKEPAESKKKRKCLCLLLPVLLILVIVVGVLFGKKNGGGVDETAGAAATGTIEGALVPPAVVANEMTIPSSHPSAAPSDQLSLKPSTSPSTECPPGTKLLSITHLQHSEHYLPTLANEDATWKIKDACSGEVIAKCLPCSLGSFESNPSQYNDGPTLRRSEESLLKHITECLPMNNEYAFEILPAEDSEPCCGFDPTTSIISYDNSMLINYEASDLDLFGEINVHFGERERPCESDPPSISPSISASTTPSMVPSKKSSSAPSSSPRSRPSLAPSSEPTHVPSISPSFSPTLAPSTSLPTESPVFFLGGCPETFVPSSFYMVGTQIESDGIIYECVTFSCGSDAFDPSSSAISLWREDWEIVGSCFGTKLPTSYPTIRPTTNPMKSPSRFPTLSPSKEPTSLPVKTCSTEKEFNLCLAIDMSGSVCNHGSGSNCVGCQPTIIAIISFFTQCRDLFVSEDTCCNNFATVKEFSSLMVDSLDDFDAERAFSVVQFATTAQLVRGLSSAEQTISAIDQLDYTGGLTNHESAIQTCQRTFSSEDNRKNFIMLITDGMSSEPDFDPEGAAETAALSAKADGIFIIPVFISTNNDFSVLSFMRRLSSDGKVFDVKDFDSLNSLQDRLVDQVSCA